MRSLLREFTGELMIYKSRFLLFRKSKLVEMKNECGYKKMEHR